MGNQFGSEWRVATPEENARLMAQRSNEVKNWGKESNTYGWDADDQERIAKSRKARILRAQQVAGRTLSPEEDALLKQEIAIYHVRKGTPNLQKEVADMGAAAIQQRVQELALIKAQEQEAAMQQEAVVPAVTNVPTETVESPAAASDTEQPIDYSLKKFAENIKTKIPEYAQ